MQIFENFLRVIFMLSTIAVVADCCSSRILLLKERTMKIVQENKQHNLEEAAHQFQHLDFETADLEFNKNFTTESTITKLTDPDIEEEEKDPTTTPTMSPTESSTLLETTTTPTPTTLDDVTLPSHDFNGSAIAGDNPNYHIMDFYYMRDVLSLECSGQYLTEFCLNGGRCFRYPVGNHSFFSCECADGYVGERCESKSLKNGLLVPSPARDAKPKILMARIVFSFPMLIALSAIYIACGAIIVLKCPCRYPTAAGLHKDSSYID